jgi:uncharacterized membrane protein
VIVYPSDEKAGAARQNLLNLEKEYLIELEDAVIATKDKNGQVRLSQLVNPTAVGALTGSFWGLLIGALFLMPVMTATGTAVGAASEAISGALTDLGIDDDLLRRLGRS